MPEIITFPAADGLSLSGTLYRPQGSPSCALLMSAGTAYPQRIMASFAAWAAEQGALVLTYDYRGIGASAPELLTDLRWNKFDWGQRDLSGAIKALDQLAPNLPMLHVAHSVGGHFIGLAPNHARISKHAFIAVGVGRVLAHKPQFMLPALTLWWVLGPWSTATKGYVKPGYLWRGEPLPQAVFVDWRRWAHKANYFKDELEAGELGPSYYGSVTAPIRSWLFSDDPIAKQKAADQLLEVYPAAPKQSTMIKQSSYGLKAIGHDGFFRPRAKMLWEEVWQWLQAEDTA